MMFLAGFLFGVMASVLALWAAVSWVLKDVQD